MIEGAAILKHQHNRLAGRGDGFEHLLLDAGQIHGGARRGFTAHGGSLAHDGDHDVGASSGGLGFGDGLSAVSASVAAAEAWFQRSCRRETGIRAQDSARRRS